MAQPRRTQVERTAQTRAALVEATIESLVEKGWAATTAVEVCRRTGLTRGALVHHFPSLSDLLATALRSVCDDLIGQAGHEPRTLVETVEVTWACMSDRRFKAVIEAWLAAANDPELGREIGPVIASVAKVVGVEGALHDVIAGGDDEVFYLAARETLLGLALGRTISSNRALPHEVAVLDRLRAEASTRDRRRSRATKARR